MANADRVDNELKEISLILWQAPTKEITARLPISWFVRTVAQGRKESTAPALRPLGLQSTKRFALNLPKIFQSSQMNRQTLYKRLSLF